MKPLIPSLGIRRFLLVFSQVIILAIALYNAFFNSDSLQDGIRRFFLSSLGLVFILLAYFLAKKRNGKLW
jgi:hypothetical protein